MKKIYKLINLASNEVIGRYCTKQDAVAGMEDTIGFFNNEEPDEEKYLTPFDFMLEEADSSEINEMVTDFETARAYLGGMPNNDFTVSKKIASNNTVKLSDVTTLVNELNPSHVKALIALNRLFTIAQAWNTADNFTPDWEDEFQCKMFPCFEYDGSGFAAADCAPSNAGAHFGSRLCFKSPKRACQFGEQFIGLWNDALLSNNN